MGLLTMIAAQDKLDKLIIREKNLQSDLILNTLVALEVEMSEMANDKRWFKHWSQNKEAKEGLLAEIADVMHFYFSLAIQKSWIDKLSVVPKKIEISDEEASGLYIRSKLMLFKAFSEVTKLKDAPDHFESSWELFLTFAMHFCGFTFDELENAYFTKNEINIARQSEGY